MSVPVAIAATCGMLYALTGLFFLGSPKKFYPAVPFIALGLLGGVGFAFLPSDAKATLGVVVGLSILLAVIFNSSVFTRGGAK